MDEASDAGRASQYDRFAEEYSRLAADSIYNALYDRPAVLDLLGQVGGHRVLDAGCGAGLYAEQLLARGAEVTAVDASEVMVDLARQRLGDRARVHHHDLDRPLDWLVDASFDAVLMPLVLHYLDDRLTVLRDAHRLLVDDGRLVISTHHPMTDWMRLGGSYFDVARVEEPLRADWTISFFRQPLTTTCAEFAEAGFVIERLLEPHPSEAIRDRDPQEYDKLAHRPAFIAFRLVKRAGTHIR
jgi:SAM-dependent methyltransferase